MGTQSLCFLFFFSHLNYKKRKSFCAKQPLLFEKEKRKK